MDESYENEKLTVNRAGKIRVFFFSPSKSLKFSQVMLENCFRFKKPLKGILTNFEKGVRCFPKGAFYVHNQINIKRKNFLLNFQIFVPKFN